MTPHQQRLLPRHGDKSSVCGCFVHQVYGNDEGFVIGTFEEEGSFRRFTAKGTVIPFRLGQPLKLNGTWKDSKYGLQFQVHTYEMSVPTTIRGIEGLLGSGLVPGIGEKTAKAIVATFGVDTLRVLGEEPERILRVPGVGPKLLESVREHFGGANAEQEAMVYLMGLGVTAKKAAKAWKRLGEDTLAKVQENPYRLLEVPGIGFPVADSAALEAGWERDNPRRLLEGTRFFLGRACQQGGHAFIPEEELASHCGRELGVEPVRAAQGIADMAAKGHAVVEDGAVYPRFLYEAEVAVAEAMAATGKVKERDREAFDRLLVEEQERLGIDLNAEQREAVWCSVTAPFSVLTGGPGTGKTTTLRAILAMNEHYGERVVLSSPTGRAAKRMAEVTGRQAYTVHRMLGLKPQEDGAELQLAPVGDFEGATLVVLDEGSMEDLAIMHYVTEALGKRRLLLVGDADQLPSVGPGLVLRELIESGAGSVTVLTEVFRQAQDSGIVMNAARINRGETPDFEAYDDFRLVPSGPEDACRHLDRTFKALEKRGFDPRDIQVLSPMKKGPAGTEALNAYLQVRLNPKRSEWEAEATLKQGTVFRQGDKVMQLRNDYDREVFNGDQGYVFGVDAANRTLTVDFGVEGIPRPVEYEFGELLENLMHAWATTVHRSQGGEWPAVVMVLTNAHYNMLQRNLLYTGVTRARSMLAVVGERQAVAMAVRNDRPVQRNTRLAARIRRLMGQE